MKTVPLDNTDPGYMGEVTTNLDGGQAVLDPEPSGCEGRLVGRLYPPVEVENGDKL
jgi:hypothetical protein